MGPYMKARIVQTIKDAIDEDSTAPLEVKEAAQYVGKKQLDEAYNDGYSDAIEEQGGR